MSKKHWGYALLALGLAMIYSVSQLTAGKTDATTTQGKIENSLASLAITGSPAGSASPYLGYAAAAVGAWLAFF